MDSLRKLQPNLFLIDGGDTGEGPNYLRAWKPLILWDAMMAMGYDLISLGERDISDTSKVWLSARSMASTRFLGGNMTLKNDATPFLDTYAILQKGHVKLGVVAAMDLRLASRLPGLSLEPVEQTLNQAQKAFARANVDFRVLIYHGLLSDAERLATERTDFDLILLGHSIGRPMQSRAEPGRVPIVGPGDRGRELAWITLKTPLKSEEEKFQCTIVPLGNHVPDSPKAQTFLQKAREVGKQIYTQYSRRRTRLKPKR
ncbi:MAG: hypothetical protein Q9P14_17940 [candidate division KSB1 bacterium]|nr:hypothetical protein [candidate division KSB1 bacterium]MDQ7065339.1 hypothetical protein [candidate division KSB1 bacterium]